MKFHEFVFGQVDRLAAVPDFRMSEAGRNELSDWLLEVSGGNLKHEYPNPATWVKNHDGARRIKTVIDECVEFSTPPGLFDIKTVWHRLYPPPNAHGNCPHCGGSGWVIVERGGVEGAKKCGAGR